MRFPFEKLKETVYNPLLSFIFPSSCAVCTGILQPTEHIVCSRCLARLTPLSPDIQKRLKDEIQPAAFDELFVALEFGPVFQQLIHLLKYQRYLSLARVFAHFLFPLLSGPYDAIIAVPLNPRRERERGYNQSALICRQLSKLSGWPLDTEILKRTRNTPSQTKLNRVQRKENMRNAFVCQKEVKGMSFLLVDDVITTGSTLNACAETLKKAGAVTTDIAAIATPVDFFQKGLEERVSISEILDIGF